MSNCLPLKSPFRNRKLSKFIVTLEDLTIWKQTLIIIKLVLTTNERNGMLNSERDWHLHQRPMSGQKCETSPVITSRVMWPVRLNYSTFDSNTPRHNRFIMKIRHRCIFIIFWFDHNCSQPIVLLCVWFTRGQHSQDYHLHHNHHHNRYRHHHPGSAPLCHYYFSKIHHHLQQLFTLCAVNPSHPH